MEICWSGVLFWGCAGTSIYIDWFGRQITCRGVYRSKSNRVEKNACTKATTYADACGRSRRRPRGGGRRGRLPTCYTRQWALQTHHPPTSPLDDDSERDEERYINKHAGPRTDAVPTTHPFLVCPTTPLTGGAQARSTADCRAHSPIHCVCAYR